MSGLTSVGLFIISSFFSLLLLSMWIRMALRYFHISSLNPISQLVDTVTGRLVNPVQSLLKLKPQPRKHYDLATVIVLVFLELLKIALISLLVFHSIMPLAYFLIYMLADLIVQPCDFLFFAVLIRVIMSFVNPAWHGPIPDLLRTLTDPLLKFGRKIIPDISGFDFSPYIILMILKIITLFINSSLPWRLL
jgi:YggT family protein